MPTNSDYSSREEWLAARPTFLGASDSAGILNCGYVDQNALTIFADKVQPPQGMEVRAASEAMLVGQLIEPALCRIFQVFSGRQAWQDKEYRVRRHDTMPFIAATLDAITVDSPPSAATAIDDSIAGIIPVELKNVSQTLMQQWSDENTAPLKFQVQAAHQMLVTGAPRAYLMGLIGGNKPVIRELPRNEQFICVLQAKLVEFWGFVVRKELPTDFIDWSHDATSDALKRLHPDDNGETVELPAEAAQWSADMQMLNMEMAELEAKQRAIQNQLRAAIGDNTYGIAPDGTRWSWTTQERKEHTVAASKFRVLRKLKK